MKKTVSVMLAVILCMCMMSFPVSAENNDASDITGDNKITVSDGKNAKSLSDRNTFTKLTFKKDTTVTVSNDNAMSSIYIIWDKPVGEYKIKTPSEELTCGKYDFIHEYIKLPAGTKELTITIPQDGSIICDIYTFSSDDTPKWVQKWSPPYDEADLLVMPTHGDDEFIFFGGTIPYYAVGRGLRVQVTYMTNHWGEPYRPHEMLNSLWVSGLDHYPVMGRFPDIYSKSLAHAKTVYNYKDIIGYNVELIRRFKPKVIVGHDLNGEYGHGGHMINANALTEAVNISNDPTQYPESASKYGVWDVPKTYLHLYSENKIRMNWDEPLSGFGGKSSFEMAVESFACHKSQQKWYSVRKVEGVYDCQAFGLYRTLVGPDVEKNDFFENITFNDPAPDTDDSSVADISSDDGSATVIDSEGEKTTSSASLYIAIIMAGILVAAVVILAVSKIKSTKRNRRD